MMSTIETEAAIERYRLAIPEPLQRARLWLLWRFEPAREAGKKPLKVPYYVSGRRRSGMQGAPEDLANLATFEQAIAAFGSDSWTGLGIAHVRGCGFTSLDFDNCIDAEGVCQPEVDQFVRAADSYTEVSPSGRGLRVVVRGHISSAKQRTDEGNIEIFGESGFVTLTGRHYCGDGINELPASSVTTLTLWMAGTKAEEHTRSDQLAQARAADPIYQHLRASGAIKRDYNDGRSSVHCPFESQHTGGAGLSDTVYFLPNTGGFARGHFKCLHAHCAQRTDDDFVRELGVPQVDFSGLLGEVAALPEAPAVLVPIDWTHVGHNPPPPREWAIEGWLGIGFMTVLAGRGGVGKTLLMQQMASSLAISRQFLGAINRPRRTLVWCAEDDADELKRRQIAIAEWLGVPIGQFAGELIVLPLAGVECSLADLDRGALRLTKHAKALWEQVNDYHASAFMLDNIAHLYGGNENDRHQVTQFVNFLTGICLKAHAAGVLAGHPGKATYSEFSGSTAWENSARGRLYLSRTPPDEKGAQEDAQGLTRYISKRKTNYSAVDCVRLNYGHGVLAPDEPSPADGFLDGIRDRRALEVVMRGVASLKEMGIFGHHANNSKNFLPKELKKYNLSEGVPVSDLERAMRTLMRDGRLVVETVGEYSNRAKRAGLVAK